MKYNLQIASNQMNCEEEENEVQRGNLLKRLQIIHDQVPEQEYNSIFCYTEPIEVEIPQPMIEEEIEEEIIIQPPQVVKIDKNKHKNSILHDKKILKELQLSDECIYDQDDHSDDNDIQDPDAISPKMMVERNQPTRSLRNRKEVNYLYQSKVYLPHSYVKYRYLKKQPFTFQINMDAFLLLTLHSHLSKHEVIGLVGGTYSKQKREIRIQRIIPCKNIPGKDDFHNVEMDPMSNLLAQHELDEKGLINMGWFHSHPMFKTTPSFIDQKSHDMLSKQYDDGLYFGLIISPFKVANKSSICDTFLFFCINKEVCRVEFELQPVSSISHSDIKHLVDIYQTHLSIHSTLSMSTKWKGKHTYQDKLVGSLNAIVLKNTELSSQLDQIDNRGEKEKSIPFTEAGVEQILSMFQFQK